jgi:hypothetical protein
MRKEKQILEEIHEAQIRYSLAPLGKDRYYRRYWIFRSIPGIFVEDDDQFSEQLFDSMEIKQENNDEKMNISANHNNETNNSMINNSTGNIGKENNPLKTANNSIISCDNILSNSYFNISNMRSNEANYSNLFYFTS